MTTYHTTWAHTPERSNLFLLRLMTWISLRLGRRAARVVLHTIAGYFLSLHRRAVVLQEIICAAH